MMCGVKMSRLLGAVADLHAADASYHKDCYKRFTGSQNSKSAKAYSTEATSNTSFAHLLSDMNYDPSHLWTSIELHNMYTSYGGQLSRRSMISKLTSTLGKDLLVINNYGCASLLVFKEYATRYFSLVEANDEDNNIHMQHIIKAIKTEVKAFQKQTDYDLSQFTIEQATSDTSSTLLKLI